MSKSKATEDKKSKAKTPNAYELNPQMMEQLSMVTPDNLTQFMMGNPEIVPEAFKKKFWKNVRYLCGLSFLCGVGGTAINIVVTRAVPKVLILPTYVRIPLRFVIFGLPFLGASSKLLSMYESSGDMLEEQFIKIQRFRKTGNI